MITADIVVMDSQLTTGMPANAKAVCEGKFRAIGQTMFNRDLNCWRAGSFHNLCFVSGACMKLDGMTIDEWWMSLSEA